MPSLRPYQSEDFEICLGIFKSNIPKFFLAPELADFEDYLKRHALGQFWCITQGSKIVGCGGIHVRPEGVGRLVYGIIHADHHKKGLGRALLRFRLRELARNASVTSIQLDTSQHNPGFFKKFGFIETTSTQDAYGPGLHLHEMSLKMTPEIRQQLLQDLAS